MPILTIAAVLIVIGLLLWLATTYIPMDPFGLLDSISSVTV